MPDLLDQPEVAELDRCLALDEHVLRFNVSMEEAVVVDVVESLRDLLDDVADLLVREGVVVELPHLHHAVEVHVEQLEDHVQRVVVPEHLDASYDICMLEPDHCLDLGVSHRSLPTRELPLEGLQGVDLVRLLISYLVDDSEATLA